MGLAFINTKPGTCAKCRGTGRYNERGTCYSCAGTGKQSADRMRRNEYYNAHHSGRNEAVAAQPVAPVAPATGDPLWTNVQLYVPLVYTQLQVECDPVWEEDLSLHDAPDERCIDAFLDALDTPF